MQGYPHLIIFVEANFNEMITRPERPQCSGPMAVYFVVVLGGNRLEFTDALDCGIGQLFISGARAQRDSPLNSLS